MMILVSYSKMTSKSPLTITYGSNMLSWHTTMTLKYHSLSSPPSLFTRHVWWKLSKKGINEMQLSSANTFIQTHHIFISCLAVGAQCFSSKQWKEFYVYMNMRFTKDSKQNPYRHQNQELMNGKLHGRSS